jgi:hypothetical protein
MLLRRLPKWSTWSHVPVENGSSQLYAKSVPTFINDEIRQLPLKTSASGIFRGTSVSMISSVSISASTMETIHRPGRHWNLLALCWRKKATTLKTSCNLREAHPLASFAKGSQSLHPQLPKQKRIDVRTLLNLFGNRLPLPMPRLALNAQQNRTRSAGSVFC